MNTLIPPVGPTLPNPVPVPVPVAGDGSPPDGPVFRPQTSPVLTNPVLTGPGLASPVLTNPVFLFKSVRAGCWLVNYAPVSAGLVSFDGTIRVERHGAGRTASGDLYQRPIFFLQRPLPQAGGPTLPPLGPVLLAGPSPADGIPVLPRARYRYYLSVTDILEHSTSGNSFTFGFDMWRFTAPNAWAKEASVTAQMVWMAAPPGYPSSSDYLEGDVRNAAGAVTGRLKMGWVSERYRKATVEIDTVAGSERPLDSGSGTDWQDVFDAIGWELTLDQSDPNVAQPSGEGWSNAEMHAAMLARRDASNLDAEWRYHILAVKTIDETPRGIMYDSSGTDSNNVPREGVGIASHWDIPNTAEWGLVKGLRFGTAAAPYFRTAVHELGHALGLFHNTADNGFMNTTDVIAASATPGTPFPNNVKWAFADDDLKRLRHYPDVFVRPGGTAFGTASSSTPTISPTDLEVEMPGLELRVGALLGEVPIGAPVRVTLELVNTGDYAQRVPAKLSLKTDFLRGRVTDPAGTARSFSPVIRCIEDHPMRDLRPGESMSDAMTLMRGHEGALFPAPGVHAVEVEVRWECSDGTEAVVAGRTTVMVTGARDGTHAAAAHKVLTTPDAHLVLIFGGDHLPEGMAAIREAVEDATLRPHYAAIEAKRLAQRAGRRAPDLGRAAELVADEGVVMSPAEALKLEKLTAAAGAKKDGVERMTRALEARVADHGRPVASGRMMAGAGKPAPAMPTAAATRDSNGKAASARPRA